MSVKELNIAIATLTRTAKRLRVLKHKAMKQRRLRKVRRIIINNENVPMRLIHRYYPQDKAADVFEKGALVGYYKNPEEEEGS